MAISTCDISGTIVDVGGNAVEDATIIAYITSPFEVGTNWVPASQVETTSDASGDFTITVIQTTSISRTVIIAIEYPDGAASQKRVEYTVIVPDTATANFEDLITTP